MLISSVKGDESSGHQLWLAGPLKRHTYRIYDSQRYSVTEIFIKCIHSIVNKIRCNAVTLVFRNQRYSVTEIFIKYNHSIVYKIRCNAVTLIFRNQFFS